MATNHINFKNKSSPTRKKHFKMSIEQTQLLIDPRSNPKFSQGWRVLTAKKIDNMKTVFELVKDRPDEIK
jgi:hypothetical protein